MNFHIGKIYSMPKNLYLYKSNQPRFWMEYCKKVRLPIKNLEPINFCMEYCKDIIIFPENDEIPYSNSENNDDDDDDDDEQSWIDMKKIL
jgi:hypothetical protein